MQQTVIGLFGSFVFVEKTALVPEGNKEEQQGEKEGCPLILFVGIKYSVIHESRLRQRGILSVSAGIKAVVVEIRHKFVETHIFLKRNGFRKLRPECS